MAPPNVAVLAPCGVSNPVPVMVTDVPTVPELVDKVVMCGRAVPVPVRLTVCGLLFALSVMVSVPALFPVEVGLKTTLMTQLPAGVRAPPQVSVSE